MGVAGLDQFLLVAGQSTEGEPALLPFYIGIGVFVAVIILAALIATPSSRRRDAGKRPGKPRSPDSLHAEAKGLSRQGGDTNRSM